jgi:hypothetical protein
MAAIHAPLRARLPILLEGMMARIRPSRAVSVATLPDGSAVDAIIDEPLVESGEHFVDRSARCQLDDKERYKQNSEDLHGD